MSARFYGALAGLAAALTVTIAAAQPAQQKDQPGGAMQGLQLNRDQPVKIESDTLEVRDKSQQATFSGKVKLTQGDTVLQCQALVIFYEDGSAAPAQKKGAAKPAQKGAGVGGGGQQIKRAEAKGDVLVTQKDQTAKGDNGVFDVKTNSITLTGNVVVTQGANVLRGDRMVVVSRTGDRGLNPGRARPESASAAEGCSIPPAT